MLCWVVVIGGSLLITAGADHLKPDNRNRGTLQEKTPPTMVPPNENRGLVVFAPRGFANPQYRGGGGSQKVLTPMG